jgi:hypothetical protein
MTCPKCGQRIAVTNTEERENGVVLRRRQCRNRKCKLVIKTREAITPEPTADIIKL